MQTPSAFSRRRFLQTASALAAGPLILQSTGYAASSRRLGPNDKIVLGFVGMGKLGTGSHLNAFLKRDDVQVVAVCDVDTTRRENAKKIATDHYAKQAKGGTFAGVEGYNDFRELVARKDIDAVVIATPDHWHALIAVAAADAGKDVYCEKPMAQSILEARSMVNAVRRNKRVFQTGSQQRSSPEFRVACELVRNKVIGKLQRIEVGVGGPGKPCDLPEEAFEPGLDWNFWLGPAPMRGYNSVLSPRGVHNHFPQWRAYWEYGGGMVTDWGAHHFDIAQWGLGTDESGPLEIVPPADWQTAQKGVKLYYPGRVEVEHISENGVTFFGSEGKVYVNRGKFSLELKGASKAKYLGKEDKPSLNDQLAAVEKEFLANAKVKLHPSGDHRGNFLDCMRSRQKPICDVEIGARSVSVCHLVNFAYRHGQKLKWDAGKEQFLEGTGSAKWLRNEYRGPWRLA
jgi:predicted dehydrogenase